MLILIMIMILLKIMIRIMMVIVHNTCAGNRCSEGWTRSWRSACKTTTVHKP
jgi:hypothetical protein